MKKCLNMGAALAHHHRSGRSTRQALCLDMRTRPTPDHQATVTPATKPAPRTPPAISLVEGLSMVRAAILHEAIHLASKPRFDYPHHVFGLGAWADYSNADD